MNYYRYYMTNKLFPKRIQLPSNELSGVHHVVYNQAVGVRNMFDVSLLTLLLLCFVVNTTYPTKSC